MGKEVFIVRVLLLVTARMKVATVYVCVAVIGRVQGLRKSCQIEVTKVNCRLFRVLTKRATHVMAMSAKLGWLYFVCLKTFGTACIVFVYATIGRLSVPSGRHMPLL